MNFHDMTTDQVTSHLASLPVFFVGGLPRSGTTWIQKLLDHHQNLVCLGESHFINDLVPNLYETTINYSNRRAANLNTWAPSVQGLNDELIVPILKVAFTSLVQANLGNKDFEKVQAIGEKTPDNLIHLTRILKLFPQVRFLHVIRDGRDAAVSGFARFNSKLPPNKTRAEYVVEFAAEWSSRINRARTLMGNSENYLEVRYEDLHRSPEQQVIRMLKFLNVSSQIDLVNGCIEATSFERLSGGRQQGEIDNKSHYRRGEVGGWRDTLTAEEISSFEIVAGPVLDLLGYPRH